MACHRTEFFITICLYLLFYIFSIITGQGLNNSDCLSDTPSARRPSHDGAVFNQKAGSMGANPQCPADAA
jgi:hypothetical protein